MEQDKKMNERHICRATIEGATIIDDVFEFEAVAVPAVNGQMRYSYENYEYFMQVLRTGEANIDKSRLDSGLPLFDNHPWENSAENTLGITTKYYFDERGLVVRCRLGARADKALRADIESGIIKTVSIEGEIQIYSIVREMGKVPVYYGELWTPESLSFAPVPNDIGAQIEVKRAIQKQIEVSQQKGFLKTIISKF